MSKSEEYLDLTKYYNDRMVYSEAEAKKNKTIIEESRYRFFNEEKFLYGPRKLFGETVFWLRRGVEKKDCIICQGQKISVEEKPCSEILFAGFCIWGYFKEEFLLQFSDGSESKAVVGFSDIAYTMEQISAGNMETETKDYMSFTKILSQESSLTDQMHYLYYQEKVFAETRRLKRIIFPENSLMYIVGITIK